MTHPAPNLKQDNYRPGSSWKLMWSDEFQGESLNPDNWSHQIIPAGRYNEEWQAYTNSPANAYLENGCLVIRADHLSNQHGFNQYTSARLNTAQKQSWRYGKIAARIQLPQGKGLWPAFWMLGASCNESGGDTPWPVCGEIDILELWGSRSDATVEGCLHYADRSGEHTWMEPCPFKLEEGNFADRFHVFEIEWKKDQIVWRVDGKEYGTAPLTSDELSPFHREFYILLNLAVGGTHAGRPDQSTSFPQFMVVDWVRVYQKG